MVMVVDPLTETLKFDPSYPLLLTPYREFYEFALLRHISTHVSYFSYLSTEVLTDHRKHIRKGDFS